MDSTFSTASSPGQSQDGDRDAQRRRELSIKKRIVRPKQLRRVENDDDTLSSPGAGPSSPRRPVSPSNTQRRYDLESRRSSSPASRSDSNRDQALEATVPRTKTRPARAPRCPVAPTRSSHPPLTSCRTVYNYTRLNHIEEGTYGVVFRAKCNTTGEIYALKKLKLEEEKQGFPITSLREVMALMIGGRHENVVGIKEIVVGDTLNQ